MDATLTLTNRYHLPLKHVPLTYGLPVPRGQARHAGDFALLNAQGDAVPLHVAPMATWEDGSVRWALLDFQGDFEPSEKGAWRLVIGQDTASPAPEPPVIVAEDDDEDTVLVDTGPVEATFHRSRFDLFTTLAAGETDLIRPEDRCDIVGENANGKLFRASYDPRPRLTVEFRSPLRAVIRWEGSLFAGDGEHLTDFRVKLHFFANNPYVKLEHSVINREMPEGGVFLRSYRIELATAMARQTTKVVRQKNYGRDYLSRLVELRQNVRLSVPTQGEGETFGDAAGKLGAVGKVMIEDESAFKEDLASFPHFLQPDAPRVRLGGGYAVVYPFLGVQDDERTVVASFLRMAPQHPKAISADENRLCFDIYPRNPQPWRVSRGMTKTHHLALSFFDSVLSPQVIDREACRREYFADLPQDPINITLDPAYARQTGEVEQDRILPYLPKKYPRLETKIAGVRLHGDPLDYAGMMDWGEKIATNNEEDQGYEYAMEYFRRGDYMNYLRCVQQMLHNSTVDVVDFDPDPLRQGGTPYHTHYHQDAVCVPSHTWTEGMFTYACMTGDKEAFKAAVNLCEWLLRFTEERPEMVKLDGREIGWPIIALTAGYRHTWDQRYRDAAFGLVDFYREKIAAHGLLANLEPPGTGYTLSAYGEYAGFEGMHKLWRATGDDELRQFAAEVIGQAIDRGHIQFHSHGRFMDLYALYAVYDMTQDDKYLDIAKTACSIALSRPDWDGYFYRRVMHFLGLCHEKGLIDDRDVVLKE